MSRPLLTQSEACQQLRCCERTLRRLVIRGQLRAVKVGASVRFRPEELERFAERAQGRSR